jgi:hypothetical protein
MWLDVMPVSATTRPPSLALPPGVRGHGPAAGLLVCSYGATGPPLAALQPSRLADDPRSITGSGGLFSKGVGSDISFVIDPNDPTQLGYITDSELGQQRLRAMAAADGRADEIIGEHGLDDVEIASNGARQDFPVVAWLRECGCTGMEIEASHYISALARQLGGPEASSYPEDSAGWRRVIRRRVFTNVCGESCVGGYEPRVQRTIDAVALADGVFWRRVESELRRCGAAVGQLRALSYLDKPLGVKRHWGCRRPLGGVALLLVVHIGPMCCGRGPCAFPDAAQYLRGVPGVLTVSRTMYEVDGLPIEATTRCNQFSEVWP